MSETIGSIRRAANEFRCKNKGGRRLPDELKRRAVGLLEQHSAQAVARAVRVSRGEVVAAWRKRFDAKAMVAGSVSSGEGQPSTFLEIPRAMLSREAELDGEVEVELDGGRGRRLRVRGRLGAAQLRALVAATLERTGGASCSK